MFTEIKNTFAILEKKQKKKSLFLTILILTNVVIEIIALFLVYEFIRIATNSYTAELVLKKNKYLDYFFSYLSIDYNIGNLVIIILFVYFFKFIFILFFNLYQYSFLNFIKVQLHMKLYDGYLRKDYSFHLNNNPTLLIRNTETEVGQFILGCLMQMIFIFSEFTLIFGIVVALFFVNATVVIYTIYFLLIFSFLYLKIIKPSLTKYGNARIKFSSLFLKTLSEGLYGIKSVKLYNANSFFKNSLKKNAEELAKTNIFVSVISQVPRHSLELIVAAVVLFFFINNVEIIKVNPEISISLGFFVLASFKLLPSIIKIILGLQSLKYNKNAINVIKNELDSINFSENVSDIDFNSKLKKVKFTKKIILKNISFRYQSSKTPIFQKLNFIINKGDKIGIFGKSGSGKSTLVDIITGLLDLQKGYLKIDKTKITKKNKINWISKIGYVPQKIYMTDDTIINNIAFGQSFIDRAKIKTIATQLDLNKIINVRKKINNIGQEGVKLSGGQIQRIGIARCLYKDPEILIFDESTSSLDSSSEKKILGIIKKISISKTVIIVSHNLNNLKFCNKIYKIEKNCLLKIKG